MRKRRNKKIIYTALGTTVAIAAIVNVVDTVNVKADSATLIFNKIEGGYEVIGISSTEMIGEIIIPDTYDGENIISIAPNAFKDSKAISINFEKPENIEFIGENAFNNSSATNDVNFPSLINIPKDTFNGASFKNVTLENATSIGLGNFDDTNKGTGKISLPSLEEIPKNLFKKSNFTHIDLNPNKVKSIGADAFNNAKATNSVSFPLLTHVNNYAFYGSSFSEITLENVKTIGIGNVNSSNKSVGIINLPNLEIVTDYMFQDSKFKEINLNPDKVTFIGVNAFENAKAKNNVSFPLLTTIPANTFYGASFNSIKVDNATTIGIGNFDASNKGKGEISALSMTSIPANIFKSSNFTSINLNPKKVNFIAANAFYEAKFKNSVSFPLLTTVPANTFNGASFENVTLESATSIGLGNFDDKNKGTGKVSLPSLKKIQSNLFKNSNFSNIDLNPYEVNSIGAYAFNGAKATNDLYLPLLTSLNENIFYGASFKNIDLDNVTTIGIGNFDDKNNGVGSIYVPSLKIIAPNTFKGSNFTYIYLNEFDITSIGANAFKDSKFTQKVEFSSIKTLPANAFNGASFKEITLNNINNFGVGNFDDKNTKTKTVNLYGLTSIVANGFKNSNIENIYIDGDTVKSIGAYAFYNSNFKDSISFSGIETLSTNALNGASFEDVILDNATSIGLGNFDDKNNGTGTIYLPKLTKIPADVFKNSNFTHVELSMDEIISIGANAFYNNKFDNYILDLPKLKTLNQDALNGSSFDYIYLDNVTTIGTGNFDQSNRSTGIVFLPSLKIIPDYAFKNSNLSHIGINEEIITSIGAYAFYNTKIKHSVSFPSITSLAKNAFNGSSFQNIDLENVKTITVGNFDNTNRSKGTVFLPNLTTIPSRAFSGSNFTNIVLDSDKVTSIGTYAFNESKATNKMILNNLKIVNSYSFFGSNFSSIELEKAEQINQYAFSKVLNNKHIFIPNAKTISDYAFYYASSNKITLGSEVLTIGRNAFSNTIATNKLSLPKSTTLDYYAFENSNFEFITFGPNTTLKPYVSTYFTTYADYVFKDVKADVLLSKISNEKEKHSEVVFIDIDSKIDLSVEYVWTKSKSEPLAHKWTTIKNDTFVNTPRTESYQGEYYLHVRYKPNVKNSKTTYIRSEAFKINTELKENEIKFEDIFVNELIDVDVSDLNINENVNIVDQISSINESIPLLGINKPKNDEIKPLDYSLFVYGEDYIHDEPTEFDDFDEDILETDEDVKNDEEVIEDVIENVDEKENQEGVNKEKASLNLIKGDFILETSDVTSFGKITLTSKKQIVSANFEKDFNVIDARGTQEGWTITVSSTPFTESIFDGFIGQPIQLPIGSLSLDKIETVTQIGKVYKNTTPTINQNTNIIDSGAIKTLQADNGQGMGEFNIIYNNNALHLVIDSTTAKIDKVNYPNSYTPYESTITWDLISGP